MKKVLYVFGGEKASGAEIVIQRLIDYNLDSVQPFLFISPGKFAEDLIAAKKPYPIVAVSRLRKLNRSSTSTINFIISAITNYLSISFKVIKYIRKNKIDIIHANTIVPASYLLPAIFYCKVLDKKKVWIWSDHDLKYFSKIDRVLSGKCVSAYNKTLVVSQAVKDKYGQEKTVSVLYNGLDLNVFKANIADRTNFRIRHHFTDEQIVFSIAGTISPRKGQLQLIKVFKELLKNYPNIMLLIAGGFGNDDTDYNEVFSTTIRGSKNIIYVGNVENMIEFYNGVDVLINNSNKTEGEPLGTTIYEAMSCEKIVIASYTGGTPEIISDKEDGFLFKAEDGQDLKRTMENVLVDLSNQTKLKSMARRKVETRFNILSMVKLYNKCLLNG